MTKSPGNPEDQQRASGAAPSLLARLEVFFGEVHPAAARVYASLQTDDLPRNCALSGSIRGPFCRYASTLQSSASLVSRSHNGGLLAEAVLPDPCFWSPDLPHLYRVQVALTAGQRRLVSAERLLGIRPLGIRGRKLLWEGKPYVVRGVRQRAVAGPHELDEWRESGAAIVADSPCDELCREASELGVLVVADLCGRGARCEEEIAYLAQWPAVGIVLVDQSAAVARTWRGARNLVLVRRWQACHSADELRAESAVLCEAVDIAAISGLAAATDSPVFAYRPVEGQVSVPAARRLCDALQRDLAGRGEFVGYLV